MKLLLFLVFLSVLSCAESFITDYEYGEMLYKNPRGVGCILCHGEDGYGRVIAKYKKSDKTDVYTIIKGANIRKKSLKEMIKALNSYHKVMPRYYLTNDEVKYIFDYLRLKNYRFGDKEE